MVDRHRAVVGALLLLGASVPARADGPFARIAFLRPVDGDTIGFEAGYPVWPRASPPVRAK